MIGIYDDYTRNDIKKNRVEELKYYYKMNKFILFLVTITIIIIFLLFIRNKDVHGEFFKRVIEFCNIV